MKRADDQPVIGCPHGDWAGASEGAFHAHMRFWHPDEMTPGEVTDDADEALDRWLENPRDGERLADLFEAVTGKRPRAERAHGL